MARLTTTEAAKLLGVSTRTLLRWEEKGKITSIRTPGGHRRYDSAKLLGETSSKRKTIAYARTSSHEQKEDLKRQEQVLESYCANHGWEFEIISDFGSGINYRKKGLNTLLKAICSDEVERLVLTHKDRLLRFGAELVFRMCELFNTEVIIINQSEEVSFEEELVTDVLEIITGLEARLYGSRSHKNRKIVAQLRKTAESLRE